MTCQQGPPIAKAMPKSPNDPSQDDLSQRLSALKEQLGEPRRKIGKNAEASGSSDKSGIGMAFRLSSEFIAGVLVGAAIGYGIDYFAGTAPLGLIIFLLLGFCAAVLNVLRSSGMVAESGLERHKKPSSAEAEMPSRDTNRDGAGQDR